MSQPRHGFRAGLDSVLLGASVGPSARRLLDLGAGVGTASLVALRLNPDLQATLAERDPDMVALAQGNLANNNLLDRASAIAVDVTARGAERLAAGLAENAFDTIIANPPFFDGSAGTHAADPSRAGARHMDAAALDLWVKSAATSAAAGAQIIFIFPASELPSLLASFDQRFGAITILPLAPRPDAPATRMLIRARKGSRAPLSLLHTRALHEADGRAFAPAFDAIFRGEQGLVW
ncbi:tRNA1(Val) (adenine(37)-N6)-methyltransferase [Devosia submarina]|uniref:tRNA1(Val) (adenine(37)-N6)-methyltransferase n=1 Tax=Devosia submarina TaxID=1173082 RepID=UPI0013003AF5|nr:methyltransferase [Devosia submarina]